MKAVINTLKREIEWINENLQKGRFVDKDIPLKNEQLKELEKAIEILENSERQTPTKVSEQHDCRVLHTAFVSNLFNVDNAPTFNEWLTKYFEPAKVSRTYKDKVKGSEYTERFLYRKYARAYKLSI